MNQFAEIIKEAGDELVQMSKSFEDKWGKSLRLGHTDWVIEHDMLQEGHMNFGPAKYFQAIREIYARACVITTEEASAMETQADLLEAQANYNAAYSWWRFWNWFNTPKKLRAKAKLKRSEQQLAERLMQIRDAKKELRKLHEIMKREESEVLSKYDGDIEKASPDIWRARAHYKSLTGQSLHNVPLPLQEKARLGTEYGNLGAAAALSVEAKYQAGFPRIEGGNGRQVHRISDRQREGMA